MTCTSIFFTDGSITISICYRIHEAHHSVRDVDWLAGARSHSLEILINQTIEFTPIILLGAAPEIVLIKGVVDAVWGMYIHSNIDVRSGEASRTFLTVRRCTAGIMQKARGMQLIILPSWQYGIGYSGPLIFHPIKKPSSFGLTYLNFPKTYFPQQWFAFRSFRKQNN